MNCLESGILIHFSKTIAISILHVFSLLHLLIHASPSPSPFAMLLPSLALMWLVVFHYIFVDSCSFASLASFYIVYASTKCYSTTSSSSNFSMNIESTNVVSSFICSFACQCFFHFCAKKNSTINVLVVSIS
jgi:hypothetical protein